MGLISGCDRALVLCPHTDDEFGCAGTIRRLVEAGVDVHYVALSKCEESVPSGFPPDILATECRACTSFLGLPATNVRIWDFRVRHFPAARQEILEEFVRLQRELRPDLVLLPSSFDMHQDHKTVYTEGFRAFKKSTLLGYELPQNLISFSNSAFVALTEQQIDAKIEGLSLYASQTFRPYASSAFIKGLAHVRGVQCGVEYAEAFELIRLVERL